MIVGITGTNGAGKGAVVDYLKQNGFGHVSASGIITKEVEKRGLEINRDSMILVGNELRRQFGSGHVAKEMLVQSERLGGDVIVESIRTLGEVEELKKRGGILLAVDADINLRYQRIKERGSEKDNVTFEEFAAQEKGESESIDANKQNLFGCIKKADFVIENNGTFEDLKIQVNNFLNKYGR